MVRMALYESKITTAVVFIAIVAASGGLLFGGYGFCMALHQRRLALDHVLGDARMHGCHSTQAHVRLVDCTQD